MDNRLIPRPRPMTAAALALVLLLVLIWIRSAYVSDLLSLSARTSEYRLRSDWGRLEFTVITGPGIDPQPLTWEALPDGGYSGVWPGPWAAMHDWGIVMYLHGRRQNSTTDSYWGVQTWHPLAIALAAIPLLPAARRMTRRLRGHRLARKGRCAACGYDLRASPGSCPECGASPAPA